MCINAGKEFAKNNLSFLNYTVLSYTITLKEIISFLFYYLFNIY